MQPFVSIRRLPDGCWHQAVLLTQESGCLHLKLSAELASTGSEIELGSLVEVHSEGLSILLGEVRHCRELALIVFIEHRLDKQTLFSDTRGMADR